MRVAVCGARDGGVDTGYRISVLGAEVVLLERSPVSRSLRYMMNFFRPGYDTAQAMGLLPAVNDIAYDISVGSLAVWVVKPADAFYAASKAALARYTRTPDM